MGFLIPKEQLDDAREKYYRELAEARAKQRAAEIAKYHKQQPEPAAMQTPEPAAKKFEYRARTPEQWDERIRETQEFGWHRPKKKRP